MGATYFDLPDGEETFSLGLHWSRQDDLTLVSSVSNGATVVKYSPATFVRQYFEMSPTAHFRFNFGGRTTELCCSSAPVIVATDTPFMVESAKGHDVAVLRIGQDVLNRKIESMLGERIPCDVRFDRSTGKEIPKQHGMKQAVIQFASDLDRWGANMPSLARKELEQALIVRFLLSNAHNFSERLATDDPAPSLQQLRLVESYIEANWDKPLDAESLARISNISARTLFRHFKNMRGVSPRGFVRGVRLRHVRNLLLAAAPNASVIAIAMKCGFQSLGHFSRDYRKAFGELPSETLRRARSSDES